GYWSRAELTAERFIPNPHGPQRGGRMYRTGDLGRYLRDGRIEYLGRSDHQVKLRGYRIELGEIESSLREHAGVREAIVIAREETSQERRLVGYVVEEEGKGVTVSELREHLKKKLPDYMVPASYVMLEELPMTPNGKIDRRALPAPETNRPEAAQDYIAPRTPIEEIVAVVWSDVLRLERIGLRDNFFDLGGHSLLAMLIISRAEEAFQIKLPLRTLFESPTVAAFAASIALLPGSKNHEPPPPIRPIDRGMEIALSFPQQRLWFLHQLDP